MATQIVNISSASWTQVSDAGVQSILTPLVPNKTYLVRYSDTQPTAIENTGHKFFAKDDSPNALVGSANTEICWMKLVSGTAQDVLVSPL